MYNYSKLTGRIIEKFKKQENFANALGISNHTLSCKLNNKVGFKQSEITKSCELLKINSNQINDYFFTLNVQ